MASASTLPVSPVNGVTPLFVKASTLATPNGTNIHGLDICYALEMVSGKDTVDCVQRIGDLFRIYAKSNDARENLLINGFTFNNVFVPLLARNPFQVKDQQVKSTKLLIGGVPMSVADSEIVGALLDLNLKLLSDLKYETYRDTGGKWTHFKTGRRFVYAEIPSLNLKPFLMIGLWKASVFYKEQIRPQRINRTRETPAEVVQTSDTTTTQETPAVLPADDTANVTEGSSVLTEATTTHVVTERNPPVHSANATIEPTTGKSTTYSFSVSRPDHLLLKEAKGEGFTDAVIKPVKKIANQRRGRSPTRHRSRRTNLRDHWSPFGRSASSKRKVSNVDSTVVDKTNIKQRKPNNNTGSIDSFVSVSTELSDLC